MKKTNHCSIDPIKATIVMSKKFYNAACRLNTPEYKELMEARRDNPDYKIEVREIAKAAKKNTYLNLTYENMEIFIRNSMESTRLLEDRLSEYKTVKELAKVQNSPYAYIKTWFLSVYGEEYNKYKKNEEEKAA